MPRSVPVTVTVVPPAMGPLLGKMSVTVGCRHILGTISKEEQLSEASMQVDELSHHPH